MARRRKIELEELLEEPWLLPGEGFFLAEAFQSRGFAVPKFGVTSYSVYQRILLLTTGRFIGMLSGSVMRFSPAEHFSLSVLPVDFSSFLAGRDRQVEESNYQSGGANLHRLHPRCREAAEGRLGGDVRRKQAGQGLGVYGASAGRPDTLIKAVDCFD